MATPAMIVEAEMRVAVVGLGAIGRRVVEALDRGLDGLVLAAVWFRSPGKHLDFLATLSRAPAILPIENLSGVADVVIESAPSALLKPIVLPFVSKGKTAIVLSAGALLGHDEAPLRRRTQDRVARGCNVAPAAFSES